MSIIGAHEILQATNCRVLTLPAVSLSSVCVAWNLKKEEGGKENAEPSGEQSVGQLSLAAVTELFKVMPCCAYPKQREREPYYLGIRMS